MNENYRKACSRNEISPNQSFKWRKSTKTIDSSTFHLIGWWYDEYVATNEAAFTSFIVQRIVTLCRENDRKGIKSLLISQLIELHRLGLRRPSFRVAIDKNQP